MQRAKTESSRREAEADEGSTAYAMDFLNTVWQFSFGGDKDMESGQKSLEAILDQLTKAIAKDKDAPHALTPAEITPIKAICDQLFPANFRLKVPGADDSAPKRPKRVHYQHIYENETLTIGIFILPPGVSIPLHDHPGMSVISRVLYGSLVIKSYDLVKGGEVSNGRKTARLRVDEILTAPHTTELLPDFGNLHELVGDDDIGCAFLDIITPPYDPTDGRDCTYFRVLGSVDNQEDASEKLVTLEAYIPEEFDVITEEYHGPHLLS